jgi:hypothetical protein
LLETPAIILALNSALLEVTLLWRKNPFCALKVVFSALLRFLNPKPFKPWTLLELQLVAWILFLSSVRTRAHQGLRIGYRLDRRCGDGGGRGVAAKKKQRKYL